MLNFIVRLVVYSERPDEKLYFEKFAAQFGVELIELTEDPSPESARFASGIECVTCITTPLKEDTLAALSQNGVRFISTRSIGIDHFDLEAVKKFKLRIGNVSYDTDAVSNYTVMLILMAVRNIKNIARLTAAGDFSLRAGVQGRNLRNLTVGIAGTGRIGKRVIEHLASFGCKLIAFDVRENPECAKIARYVNWETFLSESDVISLHIHPSNETFHLINRGTIAKMKNGVTIINTARGSLIDSEALIEAVENGKVASAALDVHEDEFELYYKDCRGKPLKNRPLAVLRSFPNVIVTPHTAFYTDQTVSDMVENTFRSCINFINEKENQWEVQIN